jgi:hypothetical protein
VSHEFVGRMPRGSITIYTPVIPSEVEGSAFRSNVGSTLEADPSTSLGMTTNGI